ncbi:hypothetical protein DERF_003705 [Dermatophagoides farinae]|uniref:Uncharacterized protein n=1 Tax=Dermatophagoides farinae TaxID=6954 RepID=A0A922IG83_DERFA|nr:hypothetical protein DERF_003705 [Dermatophagoides farinae]
MIMIFFQYPKKKDLVPVQLNYVEYQLILNRKLFSPNEENKENYHYLIGNIKIEKKICLHQFVMHLH